MSAPTPLEPRRPSAHRRWVIVAAVLAVVVVVVLALVLLSGGSTPAAPAAPTTVAVPTESRGGEQSGRSEQRPSRSTENHTQPTRPVAPTSRSTSGNFDPNNCPPGLLC